MGNATCTQQLLALLRRNWTFKLRTGKSTLQEFIFPVLTVLFLVALTFLVSVTKSKTTLSSHAVRKIGRSLPSEHIHILCSPNTSEIQTVMNRTLKYLKSPLPLLSLYHSSAEAEEAYLNITTSVDAVGIQVIGIHFTELEDSSSIQYSLRFRARDIADTKIFFNHAHCYAWDRERLCEASIYYHTGFSTLQLALDTAIQSAFDTTATSLPDISVQMLPKTSVNLSTVSLMIVGAPLMFVITFVYFLQFLTVILVSEKETLVMQHMLLMGMRKSVYWLSWLILYVGIVAGMTVVITLICWMTSMFANCNIAILFLLFLLYGLTMIFLSFLATPFFRKAELAGNVVSLAAMMFGCLYMAVAYTRDFSHRDGPVSAIPSWCQWLLALLSPVAFSLALDQIEYIGVYKGGLNAETMVIGEFPVYGALIMLTVDCVIYLLLAIYFDIAFGGQGSKKRNFCFFLNPLFWRRPPSVLVMRDHEPVEQMIDIVGQTDVKCEPVPAEFASKNVITLRGISKSFHSAKKMALEDLSLDIYEGQITALLGHNGAGKTTLLNILTGLTSSTSGSASVCGCDVSSPRDMTAVRSMMGVCAQSNIMSAELTCCDHLRLFAQLKGVDSSSVDAAVTKCLEDVGLAAERDIMSKKLSGGQKRKLSLAMAIIGEPRILFLDEPTAGLDPVARRSVWSLLKRMKPERVIVLTTHYMDEADLLADRKAIISHGRLKCVGSSFFLKTHFGIGYQLSVDIERSSDASLASSNLTQHIQRYVEDATLLRTQGQELIFTLPLASADKFADLFRSLEERVGEQAAGGEDLVIHGYGISMTTLEEVFMRIELENEEERAYAAERNLATFCETQAAGCTAECVELQDLEKPSGEFSRLMAEDDVVEPPKPSCWHQIKALTKIRFLSEKRMPSQWLVRIIMPVALELFVALRWVVPAALLTSSHLELKAGYYVNNSFDSQSAMNPGLAFLSSSPAERFVSTLNASGIHVDILKNDVNLSAVGPYYIGINFTDMTSNSLVATILYNYTAVHALPVATNLITSTRLRMINSSARIHAYIWPWPEPELFDNHKHFAMTMMMSMIGLALILVVPTFAAEIVRDRRLKCRRQLRVSGVPFIAYWSAQFIVDIIQLVIAAMLSILIFVTFQVPAVMYPGAMLSFVLFFIGYLPDLLLLTYVLTFTFHNYQTARAVLPTLYLIYGFVPYVVILVLRRFLSAADLFIEIIILLFNPLLGVLAAVGHITEVYVTAATAANSIRPEIDINDYFVHAENARHFWAILVMPIFHILCLSFLLWKFESSVQDGEVDVCARKQQPQILPAGEQHEALNAEEAAVLLVRNLHKEYRRGRPKCLGLKRVGRDGVTDAVKVAVVNSSFTVECGEIFGLLGPNGAGKSTTLNAIIAETQPTAGNVRVCGQEIQPNESYLFRNIGFSPQEDPLWPVITLEEHLKCYAELRGISKPEVETVVRRMINAMKVGEHRKKYAKKLSGGTKRKLAYMMSMLGGPRVILLDEPSTGMDPVSRRFFWDTVLAVFNGSSRRCCLLTTHHMEEADVLCSRVAIMVNGEIKCMGSTQHLKSTHGGGYMLEVDVEPSTADIFDEDAVSTQQGRVSEEICGQLFVNARCTEQFGRHSVYHIPQTSVQRLSEVFSHLQRMKQDALISEYSFSQSSLEQVFLELARSQVEDELSPDML